MQMYVNSQIDGESCEDRLLNLKYNGVIASCCGEIEGKKLICMSLKNNFVGTFVESPKKVFQLY